MDSLVRILAIKHLLKKNQNLVSKKHIYLPYNTRKKYKL